MPVLNVDSVTGVTTTYGVLPGGRMSASTICRAVVDEAGYGRFTDAKSGTSLPGYPPQPGIIAAAIAHTVIRRTRQSCTRRVSMTDSARVLISRGSRRPRAQLQWRAVAIDRIAQRRKAGQAVGVSGRLREAVGHEHAAGTVGDRNIRLRRHHRQLWSDAARPEHRNLTLADCRSVAEIGPREILDSDCRGIAQVDRSPVRLRILRGDQDRFDRLWRTSAAAS